MTTLASLSTPPLFRIHCNTYRVINVFAGNVTCKRMPPFQVPCVCVGTFFFFLTLEEDAWIHKALGAEPLENIPCNLSDPLYWCGLVSPLQVAIHLASIICLCFARLLTPLNYFLGGLCVHICLLLWCFGVINIIISLSLSLFPYIICVHHMWSRGPTRRSISQIHVSRLTIIFWGPIASLPSKCWRFETSRCWRPHVPTRSIRESFQLWRSCFVLAPEPRSGIQRTWIQK